MSGLQKRCKSCASKYMSARYRDNELVQIAVKQRREKHRNSIRAERRTLLIGRECAHCGINDPDVLTWHHRDRTQKSFNIGDAPRLLCSLRKLRAEAEKCDVLCYNCHMKLERRFRRDSNVTALLVGEYHAPIGSAP